MGAIPTIDTSKGCWIETPSKAPQIETPLKILVYIYMCVCVCVCVSKSCSFFRQ